MTKRYLPLAIVGAVLVLVVGAGTLLFRHRLAQVPVAPQNLAAGKPGAEPPHVRGSTRGPVSIEEFGDYECLPCSAVFSALKKVEGDYGGRLSLTFRQYPLKMHQHAMDAARAAEAAGLQGRFWEMHDALYGNRFVWTRAPDVWALFDGYASAVGVDLGRFKKDVEGATVARRITDDQARAASIGVDRTPVVFVNGQRLEFSSVTVEGLHAAIDKELNAKPGRGD